MTDRIPNESELPFPDVDAEKVQTLVEGDTGTTEIAQLETAAQERWGNTWTIQTLRFADGDTQSFAFRSRGRTEDGYLEQERLFLGADSELYYDRVLLDPEEVVETMESECLSHFDD